MAAWRGGGRTGDESAFFEVRDTLLPSAVLKSLASNRNTNLANVALLFYTRKDEEGGQGYEFVHKSFGEYLTACAISDAFVRWGVQVADENSDFDEEEFLSRWIGLTGPAAITEEVYRFLDNQVRLKLSREKHPIDISRKYVDILRRLITRVIDIGFPLTNKTADYRSIETKQNNAELILWAVMDCFARVAYPVEKCRERGEQGWNPGPIDIAPLYTDPFALTKLLARQSDVFEGSSAGFSPDGQPTVLWMGFPTINRFMSRLYLPGARIPSRYGEVYDFEGCNFNGASFLSSRMFGWNFRYCDMIKANLSHCEMMYVSFEKAVVDGASFNYSEFIDIVDFSVLSKKNIHSLKSKINKNRSKARILFRR